MAGLLSGMMGGGVTGPGAVMNLGPLPPLSTSGLGAELSTPDGAINQIQSNLLAGVSPYSYGPNSARPSTQTSYVNHPHRIQKVIPKMFIPNANGTGRDLVLEHALSDGDLTFTLRMPKEMIVGPSEYCQVRNIPGRALAQLVNLATVNYLLWGLQVGRGVGDPRKNRWQDFFLRITQGRLHRTSDAVSQRAVWHFLKTYLQPFGIMTGSDMQGGQHEGGVNRVATYPVDYVGSFLIDGHCRKTNNLWRHQNIAAGSDLCLELRLTGQHERTLHHALVSGARSSCDVSTSSTAPWWFLAPAVTDVNTWDVPHIHIGRSIGMYSAYQTQAQLGQAPWSAPASILGKGVETNFAPVFNTPDWFEFSDSAPAFAPQHTGAAPAYVREEPRKGGPLLSAPPEDALGGSAAAPGAAAGAPVPGLPGAPLARTAAEAFAADDAAAAAGVASTSSVLSTGAPRKKPKVRRQTTAATFDAFPDGLGVQPGAEADPQPP